MGKRILWTFGVTFSAGFTFYFIESIMPIGDWRWLALAVICILIPAVISWKDIRDYLRKRQSSKKEDGQPEAIGYVDACNIVRAYIEPATREMSPNVRISVINDFIKRFRKTTGAMLGEHEYNRILLRQWIETNAARLLVENRNDMT